MAHKLAYGVLDRWTARHVQQAAVAVSIDLAGKLSSLLPGARIRVIHNGVDPSRIRDGASRLSCGDLPGAAQHRVAFLGRLVPLKRVNVIIEAARRLELDRPGEFLWLILGDGPQREILEQQVERLQLESTVHFLGFREDATSCLAACDVMVLASEHEGLPICILEALSLGVPVAGPKVGGLGEVIDDRCGLLADDIDADALAGMVAQLAARPRASDSLLPESFNSDSCARAYLALYGELLGHNESLPDGRSLA